MQQRPMMQGGMLMQGQGYPQQQWGAQAGYAHQMGGMHGYGQPMAAYNPQMQQQQQAMLYQQQMAGPYAAQWQAYYAQQAAQQQQLTGEQRHNYVPCESYQPRCSDAEMCAGWQCGSRRVNGRSTSPATRASWR